MRNIARCLASLGFMALLAGAACAAQKEPVEPPAAASGAEPEEQRPCMDELEKFCKDVRPGGGRIIKCLQEHDRDLSASCRDKVQSVLKRLEEAKKACAPDIGRFCPGIAPGEGRLIKCLTPHFEELTPSCREKVGPILKHAERAKQPAP